MFIDYGFYTRHIVLAILNALLSLQLQIKSTGKLGKVSCCIYSRSFCIGNLCSNGPSSDAGTFGQVLECWDREAKEMVAIKVVRSIKKYREAAMIEIDVLQLLGRYDRTGSR